MRDYHFIPLVFLVVGTVAVTCIVAAHRGPRLLDIDGHRYVSVGDSITHAASCACKRHDEVWEDK